MTNRKRNQRKVVLITGGATGIGKAIACAFARRGFSVIIHYHKSEKEADVTLKIIKEMGRTAVKICADVIDQNQVKRMFQKIKKTFGHLDVLVNNAGWTTFIDLKSLDKITEKIFNYIIDVNLKGVFLCSREAIPLMQVVKDALIINIASTSGIDGKGSNMIYCAAKAAVISLTKSFAQTFGPHIRVNSIAPGFTNTKFIKSIPHTYLKREKDATPMKRFATPEDIAKVALALYDEMFFVNGQTIIIDGGRAL